MLTSNKAKDNKQRFKIPNEIAFGLLFKRKMDNLELKYRN